MDDDLLIFMAFSFAEGFFYAIMNENNARRGFLL